MTICSFDTPIFNIKSGTCKSTKKCNKWQILRSQTFTQEKL